MPSSHSVKKSFFLSSLSNVDGNRGVRKKSRQSGQEKEVFVCFNPFGSCRITNEKKERRKRVCYPHVLHLVNVISGHLLLRREMRIASHN